MDVRPTDVIQTADLSACHVARVSLSFTVSTLYIFVHPEPCLRVRLAVILLDVRRLEKIFWCPDSLET